MILLGKNVTLASYDIVFMCLCLTTPKLRSLEEAVVLCKINEPRKWKLKVEILHDLKEFLKFYLFSITDKAEIGFIFKK